MSNNRTFKPQAHVTNSTGVRSKRNGLLINIPRDGTFVIGRFATKGDNELIFSRVRTQQNVEKLKQAQSQRMHIGPSVEDEVEDSGRTVGAESLIEDTRTANQPKESSVDDLV